eukprot:11101711-Ditylum_brightwellii.AAC.1
MSYRYAPARKQPRGRKLEALKRCGCVFGSRSNKEKEKNNDDDDSLTKMPIWDKNTTDSSSVYSTSDANTELLEESWAGGASYIYEHSDTVDFDDVSMNECCAITRNISDSSSFASVHTPKIRNS